MAAIKRALVLGNSAYPESFALSSPVNDARAVASALRDLDFHVIFDVDLGHDRMNEVINAFVKGLNADGPAITLFYYSGHGVQLAEQNFLVPIDFSDAHAIKLVPVQDVMDRIAEFSSIQIVLLDACRSNFDAHSALLSKAIRVNADKAIYVGDAAEPVSGLAEMRAATSTFIAFAAAPGDVAYEGGKALSPFTEAFIKYVDVVDLPLSNLMSRVRQDVIARTGGRQRTWDQSSLTAPFYFSPGSMFLFMGNALALAGLFIALVPYSFILDSAEVSWPWVVVGALLPLLSLAILMFGMNTVYDRLRGRFESDGDAPPTVRGHLSLSLQKGALGGYLSGLVAGLGIAFLYYRDWVVEFGRWSIATASGHDVDWIDPPEPFGMIALEIIIAAAFVACVLGILCLTFARIDIGRSGFVLAPGRSGWRTIAGAAVGGVLAGSLCAPLVMLHFGKLSRPILTPNLLLPGAVAGTAFIVFSIVNFDFERLNLRRLLIGGLAAVVAVMGGVIASAAVFGPLYRYHAVDGVINWIKHQHISDAALLGGGVIYGMPVGLVLGLVIGTAITLTERWSGKPLFWPQALAAAASTKLPYPPSPPARTP